MFVDARPRLPSKLKKEKTEVFSTSKPASEENQFEEGWTLATLFGMGEHDSGESSQRPISSSPLLTSPADAPRSGGEQDAHSDSSVNDTDHQQKNKGRKRVRRRCSPGHIYQCLPTKKPKLTKKSKLPKRARH